MSDYIAFDRSGFPVLLADGSDDPVPVSGVINVPSAQRRDLVRELAREFEDFSTQDLRERADIVQGSQAEMEKLRQDVRQQVIDDLVDVLDQRHRGRLRARRTVRLQAPKGYVRKVTNGLSEVESSDVRSRLHARGWTDDDILRTLPHQRPSR